MWYLPPLLHISSRKYLQHVLYICNCKGIDRFHIFDHIHKHICIYAHMVSIHYLLHIHVASMVLCIHMDTYHNCIFVINHIFYHLFYIYNHIKNVLLIFWSLNLVIIENTFKFKSYVLFGTDDLSDRSSRVLQLPLHVF